MGSNMENGGAPLLNEYKLDFFGKRFPQTLLGGPRLRLGFHAPFYVYINQVLMFLIPFVFGGLFTSLAEYHVLSPINCCYVYGSVVTVFVLVSQILTWQLRKSAAHAKQPQGNVLAQDDEIDFISCCGTETVEFLFPGKKFVINMVIHAVLSGPHCGLLLFYLLPSTLNPIFGSAGITGLFFTLGWLTVCVSQYSLTVSSPPEPATFRPLDNWEIAPLMRPFYSVLFGIVEILARTYPYLSTVNFALHVVFNFLPLLWVLGVLPPLDALLSWLAEQGLVQVLGGSPMASDFRLFTMVVLSSVVTVMVAFIPNYMAVMVLAASFGFILSTDIFGLVTQLRYGCLQSRGPGASNWGMKEYVNHLIMLCLGVTATAVGYHFSLSSTSTSRTTFEIFGYAFIGIVVLVKVLGDLQGVYVIFGMFRNPLYPTSIHAEHNFIRSKRRLTVIAVVYHIILRYISPLLMVTFLAMFLRPEKLTVSSFAMAVGTVRATRQVWQSTFNCLLEMAVVVIIHITLIAEWWTNAGLGLQLMLVSVCRDRIQQLATKLAFVMTLTVTSFTLPKQRHKSTVPILVLSVIFLPVFLAIVVSASLLAAPVLPLLCLPIFLVGFPRPLRSWPRVGNNVICSSVDAIYYKQLTPNLMSSLRVSMAIGAMGSPSPGDHYLVRFQDRMIWVQVLECGYRFCSLVLKGLELQETSCHTVEAARVDDVFEEAFVREDKWPIVSMNHHLGSVLRSCDTLVLDTYSDANNVLTGIIDQPDNLTRNTENFLKTLVWVLLHHCKDLNTAQLQQANTVRSQITTVQIDSSKHDSTPVVLQQINAPDSDVKIARKTLTKKRSQDDMELAFCNSAGERQSVTDSPVKRSDSLPSFSESIWSQDSLKFGGFPEGNPGKLEESFNFGGLPVADSGTRDDNDNEKTWALGGFPINDVSLPPPARTADPAKPLLSYSTLRYNLPNAFGQSNNADANHLFASTKILNAGAKSVFTSKNSQKLDLPSQWKRVPLEQTYLNSLLTKFPMSWYVFVLKSLGFGSSADADELAQDQILTGMYQQLVCTCYALVDVLGFPGSSVAEAGPSHIYKAYNAQIPWSLHQEWLNNQPELKALVVRAYRYAFKLTYDEAVLGEASSEDEIAEYLTEYDNKWYMGIDTDSLWTQAVIEGKPTLFSIGKEKDKGTYTSRVLTKQSIMAPVGRLNSEAVRGQWASLALELLYLTNDDEERYSIQAHPVLLRNLTIQAADPPLGYPVFSSGALSVPLSLDPL